MSYVLKLLRIETGNLTFVSLKFHIFFIFKSISFTLGRETRTNLEDIVLKEKKKLGIEKTLMFYSARKSFAQHAFDTGISTMVIDYLIGHSVSSSAKGSIYHYVRATPEAANAALRKVLDNLK